MDESEDYNQAQKELLLSQGYSEETIIKAQQFAREKAVSRTDRATYQAMEALIHNLNTMHSRAGAQTPFSSINYGMDTSSEGRMVVKNMLLVTEKGWATAKRRFSPFRFSG